MKKLFFTLCVITMTMVTYANDSVKVGEKITEKPKVEGSVYCIVEGNNSWCAEAATYDEAKAAARAMYTKDHQKKQDNIQYTSNDQSNDIN